MKDEALAARCRALRLVLTDVDGVLTDGTVLILPDGSEAKSFHIRDGLGMVLARRAGLKLGLLSGRTSSSVAARAAELRLDVVRQGVSDKRAALEEIVESLKKGGWEVMMIDEPRQPPLATLKLTTDDNRVMWASVEMFDTARVLVLEQDE
jgi:3-deoxy-D-manno-octulosonate 8-phosphate phosphatase (KDO 8-P phosphatase)